MNNLSRTLFAAALAVLSICPFSTAKAQLGELPFGFDEVWHARLLFNSEGGYTYRGLHDWSPLFEAHEGDEYTIVMPTASLNCENGRVELKSPINTWASHEYKLHVKLLADKNVDEVKIRLEENEEPEYVLLEHSLSLEAGQAKEVNLTASQGFGIFDLKFAFLFNTANADTKITLSELSLYDTTTNQELWVGTSYYNYCFYYNMMTYSRIKDMQILGQHESLAWTQPDFDDSMWEEEPMPVGNWGFIPEVRTIWPGGDNTNYWIRRNFTLDEVKASTAYYLRMCHDDTYKVYVNGHLMDEDPGWTTNKNYVEIEVPSKYLNKGDNVIATYIQQNYGGKFFDCSMHIVEDAYEVGDAGIDYASALIANEVTVANIDQTLDYSNNFGGWIELYNKTDKRVSLDYIYVSDDPENLQKHMLPNFGVVPPKGYKCIYFDHHSSDGAYGPGAKKQVNFKLNADGGTIYLSEDGVTPFLTINYPASISRCSYARKSLDSDEWGYNGLPTPEAANNSNYFANQRLDAPEVDTDSKLFTIPFDIKVDIPEGTTLRYTTDGSTPTLTRGTTSSDGAFHISDTQVLRFRLFADGYLPSAVVTRSYLYDDNEYYLPVISVVTNPNYLYDDYIGVYVDGLNGETGRNHGASNRNMDWERPVNFEYITPEEGMAVNMEANFAVSGGWSRHFMPASFKIKSNKVYEGVNSVDYPFFSVKPYNKYKQILVRNGGNDNDSQRHGRVRDAITQKTLISNGFYVDAQDYQPAHVFFNGEYIGQLNVREPNNRFNGTANYGYDDDEMDAFEYSNGYQQMAGTRDAFNKWLDLSANAADPAVYEEICQLVDIDEVINYFAAITYIGCSDWLGNSNNSKGYRSRLDGKFRLTVFDQDWGWSNSNGVANINNNYGNELMTIYNNMKRNPDFRQQFINSYCILGGSVFTPERCEQIGDSICNLVEKALAMEGREPWTSFEEQRSRMTSQSSRDARMQALRNCYWLGDGMEVKLSANIPEAQLMIDKQVVPDAKFNGTLFAPVTITASAPAGYRFIGWQGSSSSRATLFNKISDWKYYDKGSLDGEDWTSPDYGEEGWEWGFAPLGYYTIGTRDYNTILDYGGNARDKYPTYYFRKTFELSHEPSERDTYLLNFTADDGFVVYINGQEACRYLMPEGEILFNTYATTHAPDNPDNGSFTLDPSLMRKGLNVIAVEVHNNSASSTDIYWSASFSYQTFSESISNAGTTNQLVFDKDASGTFLAVFEPITDNALLDIANVTPICINEVSAGNDIYVNEYVKRDDWFELYNNTDADIDIAGMYLSDKENKPTKYQVEAVDGISTVVPAHGRLIVWASKRDPLTQLHAPFKLDNADGCAVSIQPADGSWRNILHYNEHSGQQSVGRYPDGGANIFTMSRPTINKTNVLCTYDFDINDVICDNASVCEVTYHLDKGWNWFSHNLSQSVAVGSVSPHATEYRSSNSSAVLGENGQWTGALNSIDPAKGYKVNATQEHNVTMKGLPYDIATPVDINRGWTWIGCPLYKPTNIDAALANYEAKDNDIITSMHHFAVYANGHWQGSLTSITPGQAYMIRTSTAKSFTWNAVTTDRQPRRSYAAEAPDETPWMIDATLYPDVMNVVATVNLDGQDLAEGCWVAAFVGDECRGAARLTEGKAFINVHGETLGNVTYKVIDARGQEYTANETSQFSGQKVVGTFTSPFVLHINGSLVVGADDAAPYIVSTQYYSLNGQRLNGPVNGLHIKRMTMSNGSVIVKKVSR